nr:hypothetical protein [uncultured Deefgea sp.]
MAAPVVLSSRKVNPLSLTSAISRAAGHNEFKAKIAQYESQAQQVRKATKEAVIAQQAEPAEVQLRSIFPHISTMAMMQLVPMRPVVMTRMSEYEVMAASVEQDDKIDIGKTLDMHA